MNAHAITLFTLGNYPMLALTVLRFCLSALSGGGSRIGQIRAIRWVKDDDPGSAINQGMAQGNKTGAQTRWQAYNRQNGQYMSLQEAVVPEQFWVDKSQCRYIDGEGQIQNPVAEDCTQAISAVRALAIAQQQGQRIYTLTRENAAAALPRLPITGALGQEVRNAVQAGKEVTIHEKPITAHGWTGYAYTIIDPDTGAGGYILEGSGNGGEMSEFDKWIVEHGSFVSAAIFAISLSILSVAVAAAAAAAAVVVTVGALAGWLMVVLAILANYQYQELMGLSDADQVGIAIADMLTIFALLTIALFAANVFVVIAALVSLITWLVVFIAQQILLADKNARCKELYLFAIGMRNGSAPDELKNLALEIS
ncbi:MAG: hypothetical protein FWH15_06640 [Betaproteobacteria bacterium]|nr:hypothetical protein [Betaproteobacteria bacterium]